MHKGSQRKQKQSEGKAKAPAVSRPTHTCTRKAKVNKNRARARPGRNSWNSNRAPTGRLPSRGPRPGLWVHCDNAWQSESKRKMKRTHLHLDCSAARHRRAQQTLDFQQTCLECKDRWDVPRFHNDHSIMKGLVPRYQRVLINCQSPGINISTDLQRSHRGGNRSPGDCTRGVHRSPGL